MKKLLLFLLLIHFQLHGQPWLSRLAINPVSASLHSDSIIGPCNFAVLADGNLAVLSSDNYNTTQFVHKINVADGQKIWQADGYGYHGGIVMAYSKSIKATSDTGCFVVSNHYSNVSLPTVRGTLIKYDSNGNVQWTETYQPSSQSDTMLNDVCEGNSNNYFIATEFFIEEKDLTSHAVLNVFGTDSVRQIFNNGQNLIAVRANGQIIGYNYNGTIIFSYNPLSSLLYADCKGTTLALLSSNTSGYKITSINSTNGNFNWNTSIAQNFYSGIAVSSLGEVAVAIGPHPFWSPTYPTSVNHCGSIAKFDSSGNLMWAKNYPFPSYGLSSIGILPSNEIVSGGHCLTIDFFGPYYYSVSLLFKVDSNGNGPIQTTTNMYPGDANGDHYLYTFDDLPYIIQQIGQTGIARDSIRAQNSQCWFQSDFCADWGTQTTAGIDNKFCDADGNGLIDTFDLNIPASFNFAAPIVYREQNTFGDITLVPEFPVVQRGDTASFFLQAGNTWQIDSINALCLALNSNGHNIIQIEPLSSNLGTLAELNFYSRIDTADWSLLAICRKDITNRVLFQNNIAKIKVAIPSNYLGNLYTIDIADLGAITQYGNRINLTGLSGTIVVDLNASINDQNSSRLNIWPNPVKETLHVNGIKSLASINILDISGKLILHSVLSPNHPQIDLESLHAGMYFLQILTDKTSNTFKFIKEF